ncbi:MAG: asparagine synthase (glutamine-hydrolyzing) [Chthoniobacterales bacterium]
MCGIAGFIGSNLSRDKLEELLRGFERDLRHRGPDDRGFFVSRDGVAGLVNTRLAILDLSPAGHQPMQSPDGRYTIVFNGEIYNFEELRAELATEGETFQSHSDTEVILKMYARYGPDCVREFAGMFAFAIWDEVEQSCFIARGPLGVKPLYYCEHAGGLVFASELRAILQTGLVPRRLCGEALAGYLLFGAVQEPLTLVQGVRVLSAGHHLLWRKRASRITKFWDMQFSDERYTNEEAVAQVRSALIESVQRHLVSDVPVGIFLSGGIDSTALLALAARERKGEVRTFCISFDDPKFNEGDVAARTAKHFGAQHTDFRLDAGTGRALLEQFVESSDQPSIDGFNTFCVAKLAHDAGLKVVLSGLGADELFGGYQSFEIIPKMVRTSRKLALLSPFRIAAGKLLQTRFVSPRLNRLGDFLTDIPLTSGAYWAMRGIFTPREVDLLLRRYGCESGGTDMPLMIHVPPQPTLEDEVSYLEMTRYMRNQLLRDSDVMSMAWGLELRVPFVDIRLMEAVQRIPAALRLAKGKKILLGAIPEIPVWVRERPKQGFTFPFKNWVTTEWRDVFGRIEATSPVPLRNWYRTWCIFALERFLERNGIEQV